jgi:hypothetical protein
LLAWVLFAALSLGAAVGLGGCSNSGKSSGSTESTTYHLVVTETSGTLTQTLDLTLVVE